MSTCIVTSLYSAQRPVLTLRRSWPQPLTFKCNIPSSDEALTPDVRSCLPQPALSDEICVVLSGTLSACLSEEDAASPQTQTLTQLPHETAASRSATSLHFCVEARKACNLDIALRRPADRRMSLRMCLLRAATSARLAPYRR